MLLFAPAKLNLALDIAGRREDGYHFVNMVMQTIDLYDEVELALTDRGIEVECFGMELPCGEDNTAFRAAGLFFERVGADCGAKISIKKKIPAGAGLAGGSADAAAVLVGLNAIMKAGLTAQQLCEIGVKVGADVPFSILGGTRLSGGIGEVLTQLPALTGCSFVVVKPEISVSTAAAYKAWDEKKPESEKGIEGVVEAVKRGDVRALSSSVFNVFEEVLELSEVKRAKEALLTLGALGAVMSGSGSAVFGIFEDKNEAEGAADMLKDKFSEVFLCAPVEKGAFIAKE